MNPILVPTLDELTVEFERRSADYESKSRAADSLPGDKEADRAADEACNALSEVCHAIARLPAQTLEHVRLKARALRWYEFDGEDAPTNTGDMLKAQLIDALLEGVPQ